MKYRSTALQLNAVQQELITNNEMLRQLDKIKSNIAEMNHRHNQFVDEYDTLAIANYNALAQNTDQALYQLNSNSIDPYKSLFNTITNNFNKLKTYGHSIIVMHTLQQSDPDHYQNHIADRVNTVCENYSTIIAANLNYIVDPIEKRSAELKLEIKNRHELSLSLNTIIIILLVILISLAAFFIYNDYRHRKDMQELLIKSKQQTEEATQIKDLFIANMSHEIRTPLNAILGFSELLSDSALDERQRQQLEAIRKSGENLQMLINDMLELAKLDAGMLQPQRAPFSIRQVVKSVQAMFLPQATEKGLQLSVQTENDIPLQLIGDANRLTQILINLVSNAVKFTHEGAIHIHIATTSKKENQLFLRISVIDTGEGIAYDQREAIFERFYQSTIRIGNGTGLGLPIVKRITEALGGYVVLESTLKKGSAFHIHLPFEVVPLQKQISHGLPPSLPANQRILLVEDNRLIRQLIVQILEVHRLSFDAAISGEEAIELLQRQENDYTLILTDLQLSDTNGYDLTIRLRNTMNIKIPIIGMSASALEGEKERCLEAGMNGYVSKPFTASELLLAIGNFIRISDSNEAILPATPFTNLNYVKQLANGNEEFIRRMKELFLIENKQELDQLDQSLQTNNFTAARQIVHHMRSTIAFVGLESKLDSLFRAFEQETSPTLLKQIAAQIKQVCKQAAQELEQSNP